MTYTRFEDLPVWQDGIALATRILEITNDKSFRFKGDIANQLQRAGLSVPNNIAEGFERGTTAELIQFLYYAKGSAGEVRSICHVINRLSAFVHLKSAVSDLTSLAAGVSRQLSAWAQSLQNTDIRGPKHLTDKSKQAWQENKNAVEFMDKLKRDHAARLEQILEERRKQNPSAPQSDI